MAMTPLRWRRRMRVISSSAGSSTLIPGDLRIIVPHMIGSNVEDPIELLPLESRNGQLHERGRCRKGIRRRGELDVAPCFLQLTTVHEGTVSDQQDILRRRLELPHQSVGRAHLELRLPGHPAWNRAVERVEDLLALRVHDGP